jgi:hypothetical protein
LSAAERFYVWYSNNLRSGLSCGKAFASRRQTMIGPSVFILGGSMEKVSNDLLTLMIELEEMHLKEEPTFQGVCRLMAYLELKQLRKEKEHGL